MRQVPSGSSGRGEVMRYSLWALGQLGETRSPACILSGAGSPLRWQKQLLRGKKVPGSFYR